MKRFLLLVLLFVLVLSACGGIANAPFEIPQKGRYTVTEELSGTAFDAVLDGVYAEFVFTAPNTVNGLRAVTMDGVGYTLTYGGVKAELSGACVETASDFTAALELLSTMGEQKNGVIFAEADDIYAEATITDNALSEIVFFNGKQKRKYKITTEA